jgi:hypothetical protein
MGAGEALVERDWRCVDELGERDIACGLCLPFLLSGWRTCLPGLDDSKSLARHCRPSLRDRAEARACLGIPSLRIPGANAAQH